MPIVCEGNLLPEPSSRSLVDTHRNVQPHDRCEWFALKNRSVVSHRAVSSPRLKPGASTANTSGDRCLIPTGTRISLPVGVSGKVCPRSGLALKHGITVLNSPGIIDPGYIGEIGVILLNTDRSQPFTVKPGERIAQLLIERFEPVEFIRDFELEPAGSRGDAGFGSSGVS